MLIVLFQLFTEEEGGQLSVHLFDVGRAHVLLLREKFSNDSVKARLSVKCDV